MRSIGIWVAVISLSGAAGGCGSTTSKSADAGAPDAACSACAEAGGAVDQCPADVGTATICASPGRACCAGGVQWHCGLCIAEMCRWVQACTPADFDAGGTCGETVSCPGNQICIVGGTCAPRCEPDAGAACAGGTSCVTATWYFNPVLFNVCQ